MRLSISVFCFFMVAWATTHSATPNGFAIYSKGDGAGRILTMRTLSTDGVGEERTICAKGSLGGDIEGQISFDGKWVAFARSRGGTPDAFGGDDYHAFGNWDVYVVRVDGNLPATPIRVAQGFWPSWGEDSYNDTKTLYYSEYVAYNLGKIWKLSVGPDGSLSSAQEIFSIVESPGYLMCAPNGQYAAHRGKVGGNGGLCVTHFAGALAGNQYFLNGGCHPHILADSKWVIHANAKKGKPNGTHTGALAGAGQYHYGSSPDMKWFVTRSEGDWTVQNVGLTVKLFTMNVTDSDISLQEQATLTDDGSWCDVHTWDTGVRINRFDANPAEITPGSQTELSWNVISATSITLNGNPVSGNSTTVTPASTTEYTLTAQGQNGPVSVTVTVTVAQPYLASIDVSPASATIAPNGSVALTASPRDQSGNAFGADITWSVSGGGSVTPATGLSTTFTSDATVGNSTVTATSGSVTRNVSIAVNDPTALHMKINCGAGAVAVDGWDDDAPYLSGSAVDFAFNASFTTTGVDNAAPVDVYATVVHAVTLGQSHTYDFADVPAGSYTVRIHFADAYGGDRAMSYTFEGQKLISGLNIVNESGGTDKVLVKTVEVTVDSDGLQIECSSDNGGDVFEAGIEIIGTGSSSQLRTITVTPTHGGQTYGVGDQITINWTATNDVEDVLMELSLDNGISFGIPITKGASIQRSDAQWGSYTWTIPEDILTDADAENCIFRVLSYSDATIFGTSGTFAIVKDVGIAPGNEALKTKAGIRIAPVTNNRLRVTFPVSGGKVQLFDLRGVLVTQGLTNNRNCTLRISSNGTYVVRAWSSRVTFVRQISFVGTCNLREPN